MSMTGISGNSPLQPKLQGEGTGGAKQRDDADKSNEAHKALHKSRSEEHQQKIKFMVTKAGNAAHTMTNALLKPLRADRIAESMFKKVHSQAIKQVSRRMANRSARRSNSESTSAAEDNKQKSMLQAQAMSKMSAKSNDSELDVETDTDSEEGGDLGGGGKDQESIIMLIKEMYGPKDQPLVKDTLSKLDNQDLSSDEKIKVVKTLHNSDMSKNPSLGESLLNTIKSDDFNKLSNSTKNVILDFMSGDNVINSKVEKTKNTSNIDRTNFKGVLQGLSYTKANNNNVENILFKYKDSNINFKLYISNQPSKLDMLGSRIDLKISKNSKDKINESIENIANKISVASNEIQSKLNPLVLKNTIKDIINKVDSDSTNFTLTLDSNLSIIKTYKVLDNTRLES